MTDKLLVGAAVLMIAVISGMGLLGVDPTESKATHKSPDVEQLK